MLTPTAPAHGGATVARQADGRVVLVHYALPGETVEVRPRGRRGGVSFATTERVVEASADRIQPRCPYFGECGGCAWQHATYERQLELKRRVVEDIWARAGLRLPPETPVRGMDDPWRYRIRGDFEAIHLPDGRLEFGFHRLRSHSVLPVRECPIHDLRIERAMLAFRQAAEELCLRDLRQLQLTVEPGGNGVLWCAGFEGSGWSAPAALGQAAAQMLPDLVLLEESMALEFWGLHFRVRSDTFVQTNYGQMLTLYRTALDFLEPASADSVLDLYAGIGTLSLAAARDSGAVTAIEENPRAVRLGLLAARINGARNVHFKTGRVESVLRSLRLGQHQAVLADPPRAGIEQSALAELLRLSPERLVYVSCEPSTQARDVAALVRGGYRVRRAALVDMFPQTYHVESVVLLDRAA